MPCFSPQQLQVMAMLKKIPAESRKKLAAKGYFPQDGYIMQYLPVPPNCLSVPDISDGISVMSSVRHSYYTSLSVCVCLSLSLVSMNFIFDFRIFQYQSLRKCWSKYRLLKARGPESRILNLTKLKLMICK